MRRGFAAGLKAKGEKTDNHQAALPDKIGLREEALAAVGEARVLDLFAGKGVMHRAVWHHAAAYLGNDSDKGQALAHPAPCHHAEAQILLRAIPLAPWNVFDLDAYGSPWNEVTVLAARRRLLPGERVAIVLTDGAPRRAMLGLTVRALAELAGEECGTVGAHRRWPMLVRQGMAEVARRMGGSLVALRQAEASLGKRGMWYGLAVLEGRPAGALGGLGAAGQGGGAAEDVAPGGAAGGEPGRGRRRR